MPARFQAPRGTFDVLPADAPARERVAHATSELLERAGYRYIETPAFEDTELFTRGVGTSTDIVRKEMFTFSDQGGRSLTLRPEATAPICRAYLEHGMHALAQPVKLWSMGPFFRHERPQAGRYRQFNQVDAEAIGSDSPLVDAEMIILLDELLKGLGVPAVRLKLSSIGTAMSRSDYREELVAFLRSHEAELAPDVVERIDENPLRAFDSKDEGTRQVMEKAPTMLERLEGDDADHFDEVRALLDQAGVNYGLDSTLVRGLDYYTRTVFAFESKHLGAQSEVGGGGRYDGLVELLGGPPTPAVGWAAGVERIVMALAAEEPEATISVFIAAPPSQSRRALTLASELRRSGISADLDLAGRALKGQMKHADRLGARHAVILGEDGSAQLRDMSSGEQREVTLESLVAEFSGA